MDVTVGDGWNDSVGEAKKYQIWNKKRDFVGKMFFWQPKKKIENEKLVFLGDHTLEYIVHGELCWMQRTGLKFRCMCLRRLMKKLVERWSGRRGVKDVRRVV